MSCITREINCLAMKEDVTSIDNEYGARCIVDLSDYETLACCTSATLRTSGGRFPMLCAD